MQTAVDAFEAWKDAEMLARAVENQLQQWWEGYLGGGPAPGLSLMADVSKARNHANDKLTVAMMLMSMAVRLADDRTPPAPQPQGAAEDTALPAAGAKR